MSYTHTDLELIWIPWFLSSELQIFIYAFLRERSKRRGTRDQDQVPVNLTFHIHRNAEWAMLMLGESIFSLLIVPVDHSFDFIVVFVLLTWACIRAQFGALCPYASASRRPRRAACCVPLRALSVRVGCYVCAVSVLCLCCVCAVSVLCLCCALPAVRACRVLIGACTSNDVVPCFVSLICAQFGALCLSS